MPRSLLWDAQRESGRQHEENDDGSRDLGIVSSRLLICTPFGPRARRRSSRAPKVLREGETACGADAGVTCPQGGSQ